MRTRDWRRAQREKRMRPARKRAEYILVKWKRWNITGVRIDRSLRQHMRNEGKNYSPIPPYYRFDNYRHGNYLSRDDRSNEAMAYDASDPDWDAGLGCFDDDLSDETDRTLWWEFLWDDQLQSIYQFDAPLVVALTESVRVPADIAEAPIPDVI